MNQHSVSLQDTFLNTLRKERVQLALYLVNGIKLLGRVESFDNYVVLLKDDRTTQMIFKHAIATIAPSRPIYYVPRSERQKAEAV